MSLKYYRFDCTQLSKVASKEVIDFLDNEAYTSCISNPQKYPDVYWGFFDENYDLKSHTKTSEALRQCVITEDMPDIN